ncbi:MAG: 4-hydroxybenzoyl-CoA reductase subunit beta [Alphaproteobacteria bacterium]|nr:4-hydroxybenzoyl-CoA reductase subunit beta [Alphaproteobacteria bacterium]
MEFMPEMQMHQPISVEDAVAQYSAAPNGRYLAGGSDLLVNIRRGIEQPDSLVYVNNIPEMRSITEDGERITIGGAVTLRELSQHLSVAEHFTAVTQAADEVAGPSHREYGTVGGNLCLDTRCIFYNQSEWWRAANNYCLKYRGDICHVAPGGKKCFAAFSGDVAPTLLLFDATVEIAGPDGRRQMPLADLYRNDGMDHLTLGSGELLVAVHIPKPTAAITSAPMTSAYAKSRIRGSIDFPLAGVAVRMAVTGGKITDLRVGLTGVSPLPFLAKGMDKFVGRVADESCLEEIRDKVRAGAKAMKTTTTPPHYRRRVAGALAQKLAASIL